MKVKTDYVPEDSKSYLTAGKVYELYDVWGEGFQMALINKSGGGDEH